LKSVFDLLKKSLQNGKPKKAKPLDLVLSVWNGKGRILAADFSKSLWGHCILSQKEVRIIPSTEKGKY
jgi:hypothetical protein